ncbi:MAG: hypothetical protein VZS44_11525, partial [Bacilli bacterium]|nr:hypothetical protein [Bacilli bacterium]
LLSTTFDCTNYAKTVSKGYASYVKYFVAFDVRSVHILRILENLNVDYDEEEGSTLIEHEMIDYAYDLINYFEEEKGIEYDGDDRLFIDEMIEKFGITDVLKTVVDYDDSNGYENYEYEARHCSVDSMVQDCVFGNGFDTLSNITI